MDINIFIEQFADLFDETDASEIQASTPFRDLNEFSSLIALSFISMVQEEYDVLLDGDEIRSAVTVEDLFNLVKSKLD